MNRLIIFGTGAALIGIWLYLSLLSSRRSLVDKNSKSQNPHVGKFEETPPDQSLVKGCFPWAVYFLQSLEYKDQEIICRGNLRGTTDWAYQQIKDNVQKIFGDRFLVLLRPELNPSQSEHQEYPEGELLNLKSKYIFVLVPNFNPQIGLWAKAHRSEALTWLGSVLIGLLPLALIGFWLYGSNVNLNQTLVIVSILIVGLIMRELARQWVARRYQVKISLPFFTPHLGGLTWHKSHIPDHQALFDLAIAPNLVSLIFGLVLVAIGLQSNDLSMEFDFKVSLLMTGLHQIFPNAMGLNSVAYAGWWCLNLMAISLIPVSILDGGYIFRSMVGARSMAIATPVMRFVILGLGLISQYWLMAVALELFLLNYAPSLPLDDATELNLGRDLVGIMMLGLGLAVILPVPEFWFW